jgi:hypothetical protein
MCRIKEINEHVRPLECVLVRSDNEAVVVTSTSRRPSGGLYKVDPSACPHRDLHEVRPERAGLGAGHLR